MLEEDFIREAKIFFSKSISDFKLEYGSSDSVLPTFRYDCGYVIEYAEIDMAGTNYKDNENNYGTDLTIYRRSWQEPEQVGLTESLYGQLEHHDSSIK